MHEFSLMAGLFRQIEKISQERNGARVVGVKIRLGALSHITPGHFKEHFEEAARGTCAANAKLDVEVLVDNHDPLAQEIVLESVEIAD